MQSSPQKFPSYSSSVDLAHPTPKQPLAYFLITTNQIYLLESFMLSSSYATASTAGLVQITRVPQTCSIRRHKSKWIDSDSQHSRQQELCVCIDFPCSPRKTHGAMGRRAQVIIYAYSVPMSQLRNIVPGNPYYKETTDKPVHPSLWKQILSLFSWSGNKSAYRL